MNQRTLVARAPRQGLLDITADVAAFVAEHPRHCGLLNAFIRHTSASLIIQENADPAVQRDLEAFLNRLVPEGDARYTHTQEGPDDMPAHIKGALTATSLNVPVQDGALALGTWQAIYLWEHRQRPRDRQVLLTLC